MKKRLFSVLSLLVVFSLLITACVSPEPPKDNSLPAQNVSETVKPEVSVSDIGKDGFSLKDIPAFSGKPYIAVNGNTPYFTKDEITADSYEFYSELDSLDRCGVTIACIGKELMPTEDRGSIGQVKPTGWHTVKYDCVDGKYLYNRCHLIGYQLTGENANVNNLVTGTRYMNVTGMLPFENMVADYIKETTLCIELRPSLTGTTCFAAVFLWKRIPWRTRARESALTYSFTTHSRV